MGWRRTSAFEQVATECRAVRERVGIADMSAFAKFNIEGPGAECWLNAVCANRMPQQDRTCLTLLLNQKGTIEGEAVIARTGPTSFYLVTGAPSERRVWDWLTLHCGVPMHDVTIINATDETGIVALAGPHARDVLQACTEQDVSNAALPWLRCAKLNVAGVPVLALRLSFTGELAYELHASNDQLGILWDALWQAGQPYKIGAFGSKALDSLRLEKFYRGGHELANDASHKDVAMQRFAATDKDFIGCDAMMARMPRSYIALLALTNEDTDALTGEAVFRGEQKVGLITSAAYGHTIGQSLAIAFLTDGTHQPGTALEVSILGKRTKARVLSDAPWDAENLRLRQ